MEGPKAVGGGGGGGGEVRKVHIVYFLSRNGGKIEQPHLLRVHHLHRNGVHLRDVKRWLSDVRGEDMPDSYAWSYKRRYKSDYVWQDLKDDDLITPFSDNEYVLKGSEIASRTDSSAAEEEAVQVQVLAPKTPRRSLRPEVCEGDQESPWTPCPPPPSVSDASDEPLERASVDAVKADLWKQIQDRHGKFMEKEAAAAAARHHRSDSGGSGGGGGGSWWPGRRTSSLLRNLLSCGAVETSNSTVTVEKDVHTDSKNKHFAKFSSSTNSRQCGKAFRPEKLHLHTKSCRGFEARERNSFDRRQ